MDQIEFISGKADEPVPNLQVSMAGHTVNNSVSQHFVISSQQVGVLEPFSAQSMSHRFASSNKQIGSMIFEDGDLVHQQLFWPNQQVGRMGSMRSNVDSRKPLLPMKRKVEGEPMGNCSAPEYVSNDHVTQMEPFVDSHVPVQQPAPHRRVQPLQYASDAQNLQNVHLPNKKMVRNESMSSKSGSLRGQNAKSRTVQLEPSPKPRGELFEAVRSKMRESLAAALALACQHQDKSPSGENNLQNRAAINLTKTSGNSQAAGSVETGGQVPDNFGQHSENPSVTDRCHDGTGMPMDTPPDCNIGSSIQRCAVQESFCGIVLPDDAPFGDNFFAKDELLQGNGLSWAMDFDSAVRETREFQAPEKPELVQEDSSDNGIGQAAVNQNLALRIEAELFKLFGGVNKKYKEKGRSLLFNLKDRSNPELREKVVSGDISPERLCSMTAEELASKELSEWRIAKAEERAQMVVLTESDVGMRRLVKKTHKGEYQVDLDKDDDFSVEVSLGTSLSQIGGKNKPKSPGGPPEADDKRSKENANGDTSSLNNKNVPYSLTIPNDGNDLMQGLMGDEFKDTDLPPIVSLDEFMESLDSEPPFQDLAVDAKQASPLPGKESTGTGDNLVDSGPSSKKDEDSSSDKIDKMDAKSTKLEENEKSLESSIEEDCVKKPSQQNVLWTESMWEGVVQLNISSLVSVVGLFKSGEKTSTKEWPSSLEIKGRVRLDAFEKFVQGLPMSRSRAVMVIHFVLTNEAAEDERANLCEAVNSYVEDERLGFAEPVQGVEVYFCPPHPRVVGMLNKHLFKDQKDILNATDNGLVGVVVWRKAHLTSSTISPNSSSHHRKNNSSLKKQHHLIPPGRQYDKDSNVNANFTSKAPVSFAPPRTTDPEPSPDDDDDVPPGFGPAAANRDEDDLPEFNFSGGLNPSLPSRVPSQDPSRVKPVYPTRVHFSPVDQVRELIQKYGQTDSNNRNPGLGFQPWDEDDDDDIPEWQPQAPQQSMFQSNTQTHGFRQPLYNPRNQIAYQSVRHQGEPVPPSLNNTTPSWQQGTRWVNPSGNHNHLPGRYDITPVLQAGPAGINWRRDPPNRSRGF